MNHISRDRYLTPEEIERNKKIIEEVEKEFVPAPGEYIEYLQAENRRLRKALVIAALPLEAIHASVEWELCKEIKQHVSEAVLAIRDVFITDLACMASKEHK